MLTSKQSAGVAPELNLRITQVRKHAKGIHPGFETQGRHYQKSKTGVSVAQRKGPKIKKKNEHDSFASAFSRCEQFCESRGKNLNCGILLLKYIKFNFMIIIANDDIRSVNKYPVVRINQL